MRTFVLCSSAMLLLAGCSEFCPEYLCGSHPTLVVVVTDADTGAPVSDVRVGVQTQDGRQSQITNFDAGERIEFYPPASTNEGHSYELGRLHVTVAADGYASAAFDVQINTDFCGRPMGARKEVALQKLATARQAIVNDGVAPKQCGQ
jgi:hypothetical protein